MSTPVPVRTNGGQVVQGKVSRPDRPVNPSAIAQAVPAAAYGIAQVLKDLIHSSRAFHSENQVLDAYKAVDTFMKAFVPASSLAALVTGEERASIEDVSKRIPPQGIAFATPTNVPAIDYDKLALAMVRAQAQYEAEQQSIASDSAEADEEPADEESEVPGYAG